jgi:hypothetical protein
MNQRWLSVLARIVQGNLFTHYFLCEGVRQTPEYQQSDDQSLSAMLQELRKCYLALRSVQAPDEADTEDNLIKPILEKLGFHYSRQKTPQQSARDRPDFLLFADAESKRKAQQDTAHYYQYGVAILEAKRFERPLDRRGGDPLDPGTPSNQILRYLSSVEIASNGKILWGILTNGRLWRLYYHKAKSRTEGYIEFDLDPLFNSEDLFKLTQEERLEAFKIFYLFFRRDAFVPTPQRPSQTFLEFALEEGKNYEERVTEDLKQKIFEEVFIFLARGFVEDAQRKGGSISQAFLDEVYKNVLTLLYRLLFILYAEDRDLLPVRDNRYDDYSLRKLRDEIEQKLDQGDNFSQRATHYWDQLKNLFRIINDGDPSINVPIYNGGLFDPQAHPFLEQYAISDYWLAQAIDRLSRDYSDPQHPRRINYRDLGVRQLGSIYEGLLEFKLRIAEEDLIVVKENGNEVYFPKAKASGKRALAEIKKGELFITNDKSERKATGSYYTPDYIVQYIVENTLSPLVQRIEDEFKKKIEELKKLKGRSYSARWKTVELAEKHDPAMKVLELKVLDPAMGSGHFLVGAVDFLADCIIELLEKYNGKKYFGDERYESPLYRQIEKIRQQIRESASEQGVTLDEAKLEDKHIIKRMVMKRCIYGVDLNEMAVELAKVSLWLHSFTVGAPLSFLDHHLKCGNSLIGVLDVSDMIAESSPRYRKFVQALHNMISVGELTDVTLADTRASAQLFAEAQGWLEPFRRSLDVSLAMEHFMKLTKNQRMTVQTAVSEGGQAQPQIQALINQALEIARQKRFFHWKLEFPEVWYTERGPRENPGFDAVVGNPPYVRQEQLKANKDYFKGAFAVYDSTADLYVYFYEAGHRLLRQNGLFGMITSNKFMRAAYGEALREYLTQGIYVKEIIDFGDLPVFAGVSAYPCILLTIKADRNDQATRYLRVPSLGFESLDQVVEQRAINLPGDALAGKSWWLMGTSEQEILKKIERVSVPLKAWLRGAKINYGIKTGFNEAFFIDEATRARLIAEDPKSAELIKPLIVGEDVKRYEIEFKGRYLIWTYIGVPIEKYPAIFAYLKRFQPQLERRWDKGEHWWELRHCDYYGDFEKPKIVFGRFMDRPLFGFDARERYFTNDAMYIAAVPDGYPVTVLNSQLGWHWLKHKCTDLRGKYIQVFIQDLEIFPIRRIFFTTPREERARLVEQLKELYSKIQDLSMSQRLLKMIEDCLPGDEAGNYLAFTRSIPVREAIAKGYLTREQAEAWALQDDDPSGFDADGKPLEHSDVVHDFLAFLAEQMIELHKQKQAEIKKFLGWLEAELQIQPDSRGRVGLEALANKTTLKNFLGDYQKNEPHLEFGGFWQLLKENERRLGVELSPNFRERLDKYYQETLRTLLPIKEKLKRTDALIDQIVYKLYGLTENEIALIEGRQRELGED